VVIRESHCLGFEEPDEWTVREWRKGQGVDPYDEMNDLLMDIISLKNRTGKAQLTHEENAQFYLACYDLDRFRDAVFKKQLWEAFAVEEGAVKALEEDDVTLMQFGIEWLKKELFSGEEENNEKEEK
jgi:hypothetical protein